EMKTIYRMMRELQASLGQQAQAERLFGNLLSLEPTAELGRGISPKIQQPFQAAKTYMSARGRLVVSCQVDAEAAAVQVQVQADPAELVGGARVVYRLADGSEQIIEAIGRGSHTLRVPTTEPVTLICAALDEHGNRLSETGSWREPLTLTPPAPQQQQQQQQPAVSAARRREAPSPPLYGRWYVWSAATVLAAGAGGYFGWQAREAEKELAQLNRNSPDFDFSEAEEIEQRGRRNALIANISLGAAGVFAIATVVSFVLEPDAPATEETTALAPLLLQQGAGLSVAFTF
ncbi:MAG TPA: hypothetical protein VNM90_13455, partial [Haliangium sp.]|nr:hypothetical protein [Haliangium sp.]